MPFPCARMSAVSLHDLTFAELEHKLVTDGLARAHARALWRAVHRESALDLASRTDLSPPLQRWLAARLPQEVTLDMPAINARIDSSDGLTRKLLLRLEDGQEIETVVMGFTGRYTACLSTQAGCAMGCVFCATGQMGFVRHLRTGEIVAQVLHAQRLLQGIGEKGLRNLVMMGMGEPLHNYDAVMKALEIITDDRGVGLGPAHISVSTVGVVPGILRMAAEQRPYNLAVSLHAATDAERSALVPSNRRWPLAELITACRTYIEKTGRRVFFGWTLIEGKNDSPAQARQVAALLHGLNAHVNLIPLNPTQGFEGRTTGTSAVDAFQEILQEAGFPCTVRQRRGIDVAAGCGQLRASKRERAAA
ncbi:MAG: radical enzyme Cfr family [Verrucomicrobiaceae bacterium]|nr:radical enzyme Cfr family [Verrucomicrobiaceae bacterium]